MTRKLKLSTLFIYFAVLQLSLISGSLYSANEQYENQQISNININVEAAEANAPYHEKSIRARIKTKEKHFFSQSDFDRDLKDLAKDYDRIEPELESIDGEMHITLTVWPKPTIRHIHWDGNCRVATKELRKELGIGPPTVFDHQEFNQAFHKLKIFYIKKGFFEAQLSYETRYVKETNEVDIVVCICEGRAGRIKDIVFRNFASCERDDILDMMVTKKYNFFFSWLTEEGTYHEEAIQQDQFVILNYLQNRGFADAEVEIEVCEANEDNRIIIYITANKGPRYYFGDITFEGNTIFTDEKICSVLLTKTGRSYSPEKIRNTLQRITNLYGKYGYIEAFVNFEPKLECDSNVYSVHFTIDEGEQYRVGLIKVFGNCTTQSRVILNETLLTPGEVFNLEKLGRTERRLCNIGYFENVNVYAVRTDEETSCLGGNYRDVHIEVEETTTGTFGAFAGFSTAEDLFAGFNLTEKNFNMAGLKTLFSRGPCSLRGGGEYANFTASWGQKSRKYIFSWTKPYFRDTPWSIGFDLENSCNRYISSDYDINSSGFNVHGIYDYNAFVNIGVHYRVRYSNVDVDADAEDKQLRKQAEKDSGIISAVGSSVIYDSTNSILRPSKGLKSCFEVEVAGLLGDYAFFSFAYTNTWYYQIAERDVLKLRADARFIQPYGHTTPFNLPLDERFFLGGENEIRGFRPYRLGPKFKKYDYEDRGYKNSDDPSGGISLQLLSAEYQHRIWDRLDVFGFIDSGHLSDRHWDFGKMYTSFGVGARLQIMGSGPPLTIGYGVPINAKRSTNVKRFFMNVGGRF